jgi:hypothetical protein
LIISYVVPGRFLPDETAMRKYMVDILRLLRYNILG